MAIIGSAILGPLIGGALGIGAALIGSHSTHQATQTAANAATQAADQNNALQQQIYQSNTANISPWMQFGNAAGSAQNALLGLGGDTAGANTAYQNYLGSTDYQWQQDQARRATNASFASRGGFRSGAALKALQDRAQNIGNGYFQSYLDRLNGVSQTGLSGANALAGVGSTYANAVGQNNDSAASAVGNAALTGAASTNALLGQGANALGYLTGQGAFGSSYHPAASSSYVPGYNPVWQGG